ncbi:unnamed protein product [Ectocarpus sp. CCAP 1310/34]|nr:unnamed protein product [Ectocarpus sp. CCAP 1310/34]
MFNMICMPLLLPLVVLLLPLQQAQSFVGGALSTTTSSANLRWRGGSSVDAAASTGPGEAAAAAAAGQDESDVMIGRGPQEPVRPFVPDLLSRKKALVTGGNRGIGEAITVALVKAGAQVCVMAGNEAAYRDMVERHGFDDTEGTGNVHWVRADLRVPSEAIAGAQKAVDWAGGSLDILVNNAGICVLEDFMDISSDTFDEVIAINTRAPLLVSQVCLQGMIKKKYGKIVNITSQSAVIATKAHASYCASKAAMDGLLHGLVCDLAQHNIQVNNIAPTVAWSDMGIKTWGDPAKSRPMLERTPIGRFVEPWEIANMVVFLSSDACTMCLGQTICVDGGYTCL